VETGQADRLADPPGTDYVDFAVFLSDSTAALLTGPIGTPDQGPATVTQLWTLDLPTGAYTKIGGPGQAAHLYALTDGIAVGVDTPDGIGSTLYRVASDGSLVHLADAPLPQVWLAPDGRHFAYGSSDGSSTMVVDVATGVPNRISRGTPFGFSPDGKLLRIDFTDGTARAVDPDGTLVRGVVDGTHATWVATSSGTGLPTPGPTPPVIALPTVTDLACSAIGVGGWTITGSPSDPQVVWLVSGDGTRMATKLVWPPGYRARFNPDLQILDANGLVVYLDGDQVLSGCDQGPSSDPQSTMLILPPGG
jgi:hypothetical protein